MKLTNAETGRYVFCEGPPNELSKVLPISPARMAQIVDGLPVARMALLDQSTHPPCLLNGNEVVGEVQANAAAASYISAMFWERNVLLIREACHRNQRSWAGAQPRGEKGKIVELIEKGLTNEVVQGRLASAGVRITLRWIQKVREELEARTENLALAREVHTQRR
jgi:hypothetical protein